MNNNAKPRLLTNPFVIAIVALFCCALWGSATPFIKTGYALMLPEKDVPSTILFAGLRFLLAGFLTVLVYCLARRKLLLPRRENLGRISILASFQTIIQYLFFYIGLANTSGVKGTVLSASNAFFCLLVASLIFRQEKLTAKKIFACVLGFSGIIVINLQGLDFTMNFTGDAFVIFSAISAAVASVLIKRFSKYEDSVVLSGYQFIFGGIVMIAVGLFTGGNVTIDSLSAVGVLIYLAFLSAAAFTLWGLLLQHNPVSKVTVYHFTVPVFGVILSKLMLTEQSNVSTLNLILTLVLISSGILILNAKKD
ncbi:MAG: DMT family transporter [Oscillospiraceae bacterium]|nr:DMT family transporter [Oscillospiraceae bacterium]MBQ7054718.1 DMT family transporter [Oscillospiraceae bacterium]